MKPLIVKDPPPEVQERIAKVVERMNREKHVKKEAAS